MFRKFIKRIIVFVLRCLPLDGILRVLQACSAFVAALVFFREWKVQAYGRPQFFKHRISLACWGHDPSAWSFTARGVHARENMFKGCRVLDLCCGDGFYSYFYFSDVAQKIDAVDNDLTALSYAKRCHGASVIEYHKINIVEQPLPARLYDVVVWNAAICYFTGSEIEHILKEVARVGKDDMVLCGMAPKASGYPDHKCEFQTGDALKILFQHHFRSVTVREAHENSAVFYFRAQGIIR